MKRTDWGLTIAFILLAISLIFLFIPYQTADGSIKIFDHYINIDNLGVLGDYVGGITTPFLSIAAFILLYRTYQSQKKELELTRAEMKAQNDYASKNLLISIKSLFIKTASEYSHGCNEEWRRESEYETYFINTITEIIISIEVMDRMIEVYTEIPKEENMTNLIYYLFWKQLDTSIREWLRDDTMAIVKEMPSDDAYRIQIETIHSKFKEYFEPKKPLTLGQL